MAATYCPYCNSTVPVPEPMPADGQMDCPRCGERFPIGTLVPDQPPAPEPEPEPSFAPQSTGGASTSGLLKAGVIVLGLGLVGVMVGLVLQHSDSSDPAQHRERVAAKFAPAKWQGFRYLPTTTNAVLAVRPARLETLFATQPDAEEDNWASLFTQRSNFLNTLTGRGFSTYDQALLGVQVRDAAFPQGFLVLTAEEPLNRQLIQQQAKTPYRAADRLLYPVEAKPASLELRLWLPDDPHTLVASLEGSDFAALPSQARAEPEVPPLLQDLMAQIPEDSIVWAVADTTRWQTNLLLRVGLSGLLPKLTPEQLDTMESLVLAVTPDQPVTLQAWLQLEPFTAAEQLRAYLSERFAAIPEPRPVVGGAENEVYLRIPAQLDQLKAVLDRLRD